FAHDPSPLECAVPSDNKRFLAICRVLARSLVILPGSWAMGELYLLFYGTAGQHLLNLPGSHILPFALVQKQAFSCENARRVRGTKETKVPPDFRTYQKPPARSSVHFRLVRVR